MMGLRWYHWALIVVWGGFSTLGAAGGGPAYMIGYSIGAFGAVTAIVWTVVYFWRRGDGEPEVETTQSAK